MLLFLNLGTMAVALIAALYGGHLFMEVVYEGLTPGVVVWPYSRTSIHGMIAFLFVLLIHAGILGVRYLWAYRPWQPAGLYVIAWCQFLGAHLVLLLVAFLIASVFRLFSSVEAGQTVHGGNLPGVWVLLFSFCFTARSIGREVFFLGPLEPTWQKCAADG